MKERLWIVTELYYPELTSTGYYLTKIAEGLADIIDVKVICAQPNYLYKGITAPMNEVRNGVEIFRVYSTRLNKNIIPFKLINMTTLSFSVFFKSIFRGFTAGDRVLVVTTPPALPFIVAVATLFRGASYTLLIHDNYPEVLVATEKVSSDSILVKLMNFSNRWLYKHAARIIVVGRDMKELLERKTAGLDVTIDFIPNWAELEIVEPRPKEENQLLKSLNLTDKFVFLYAGNMGYPNDLESLVQCISEMREDDRFHFLFLGTGAKRRWLELQIEKLKLKNVSLLDPRPRHEQIEFLNACDVAIVSLVKGMRGVSVPSRIYNLLAAGKPILAIVDESSEVSKIVEEEGVGWVVEPSQPAVLHEKIIEIYRNKHLLAEMGERARLTAVSKYSLDHAMNRYREVLMK